MVLRRCFFFLLFFLLFTFSTKHFLFWKYVHSFSCLLLYTHRHTHERHVIQINNRWYLVNERQPIDSNSRCCLLPSLLNVWNQKEILMSILCSWCVRTFFHIQNAKIVNQERTFVVRVNTFTCVLLKKKIGSSTFALNNICINIMDTNDRKYN